jgi:hypothetical protein
MAMNPFLRAIDALNSHDVRYVIVGGFAGYMHGTRRITVDLDIVIDLSPDKARKSIEALLSSGFAARLPVDPLQFADEKTRESWINEKHMVVFSFFHPAHPGFILDVFVREPKPFGELEARSEVIELEGHKVRVCSIDDLIDLKRVAGRPQDLVDITTLETIKSLKKQGAQ